MSHHRVSCRKTCLECGRALLKAREKLDNIKPKLPARKLPAAPPSLPATPRARDTPADSKLVHEGNRAAIEHWLKDSLASISPSSPPITEGMRFLAGDAREASRAAGRARISPTSAVCGDDDVAGAYFRAEPLVLGDRHLSE